jgi:hypothetical protein
MDIYRFFHPHHNPRLHSTPLRQQELSELEQAASELRKALERSQQRNTRKPAGPILPAHFNDIIKAIRFVEQSLQTLCDAHDGDSYETLLELIHERSSFSGWEAWTSLVKEQLDLDSHHPISGELRPQHPEGISQLDARAIQPIEIEKSPPIVNHRETRAERRTEARSRRINLSDQKLTGTLS